MDRTLLWLLLGLVILLAVATVVGQMLAQRASGASAIATMDNLNKRIRAWWLMVAVLAIAFFFGKAVTLVLFALTSFYCLREFISLTPTRPADHAALAAAFYVFLPLQYMLIGIDWGGTKIEAIALSAEGEVLDRRRLHEEVWGYTFDPGTNVADVFVGYLRRKLEADGSPRVLHTVRGVGWALRP